MTTICVDGTDHFSSALYLFRQTPVMTLDPSPVTRCIYATLLFGSVGWCDIDPALATDSTSKNESRTIVVEIHT